jgi:outer membrane protein assembly factor BamB
MLRALLQQSELKLIGVDPDRDTVHALRAELAAQGVYGSRVELFVGDPVRFEFPPYLASLIVAQDPRAAGFPDASAARLADVLRPYGGRLCVTLPADQQPAFAQWIGSAGDDSPHLRRFGDWAVFERPGPLAGATAWTHECGDAARTYFSRDRGVKSPLSVLWYGDGPDHGFWKHKDYGTGVKPQVIGGRLIAFQVHTSSLLAYDVYTGRMLWKQAVDPFTRYACLEDGVYVAGGNQLRVLDLASGGERAVWPLEIESGQKPFVADVRVDGDVIVAALAPQKVRVIEQGLWDSTTLVALDRRTGQTLWRKPAEQRFNNHALAMGGGLVYAVDSRSPIETDKAQRLGESPLAAEQPSTILALDARTGEVRWSQVVQNPFRTYGMGGWTAMRANDDWLAYADEAGLLLSGKFNRAAAYDAQRGEVAWEAQVAPGQPWILRGDTALLQSGQIVDLRTGKPAGDAFSLRRGGCNYAVAGEQLILLRDRSACYVDVDTRHKQPLYAVRSGCSNSLIAADGLLSVPNFAVGCVCNYPVQTSFAMVHVAEQD